MAGRLPADLAAALDAAAPRLGPFRAIDYFPDIGSTNDVALERASAGAPHGTLVLADAQQAGRGRRGRTWHSPAEAGLYLSAVLRADSWAGALPLVTIAAGVAVADGLRAATALPVELKWPNDVVIGRPWRKLAGILAESASASPRVEAIVVGIGVNVRPSAFPAEIADRATALEIEASRPVDRAACLVEILAALATWLDRLRAGELHAVVDAWRTRGRAGLGGAAVRWNDETGERRGTARDIDDTGALLVDTGGGRTRLVAGEVIWERLRGE
jgi:BirA family biotin operon repressor/biotin-[acetyl-CoA-carboxylase] ligase